MLRDILEMLKVVNGETERIRIAQGKHELPENLKDAYKQIKRELKWERK